MIWYFVFTPPLAVPWTYQENAYIRQQLTEYYAVVNPSEEVHVWMGLYEYLNFTNGIPYWRFTNEEPVNFGDWYQGEPYLDAYASFTGNILAGRFFHWAVFEGRIPYPFICEYKV